MGPNACLSLKFPQILVKITEDKVPKADVSEPDMAQPVESTWQDRLTGERFTVPEPRHSRGMQKAGRQTAAFTACNNQLPTSTQHKVNSNVLQARHESTDAQFPNNFITELSCNSPMK
ncbi:hypothetical protein GW7_20864 [Heterocephalus glaber]|uniref:Uncharacterized protein n=1 Tax=Heterocephalus glaber TaxID=10181 RepID=G5BVE3_HETGA|nr:hypothetical protein GW7_20864 [Heterocephalus glaber]